jgi:hypothetical protein
VHVTPTTTVSKKTPGHLTTDIINTTYPTSIGKPPHGGGHGNGRRNYGETGDIKHAYVN